MAQEEKPQKGTPLSVNPEDRTVIRRDGGSEETPSRPKIYLPPYVVVVDGPRVGSRFPLRDDPNIIGRAIGVSVRLDDQSVSRQHAEITKAKGGWIVKDLGSKNGTSVNGVLLTDPVIIGHKDLVKTGIYILRLIAQETPLHEEMTLPPELASADKTLMGNAPPEAPTASAISQMKKEKKNDIDEESVEVRPSSRMKKILMWGGGAVVIVLLATFLSKSLFKSSSKIKEGLQTPAMEEPLASEEIASLTPPEATAPPSPPVLPTEPATPSFPEPPGMTPTPGQEMPSASAPAMPPSVSVPQTAEAAKIPLFLDFVSSPLPAKIHFLEKELGVTPLRVNMSLEPNRTYAVQAVFEMPEIKETYTQQVEFTVDPEKSMVPLLFRGPIGIIRIDQLPRDVELYLEGSFDHDQFRQRSLKFDDIVLQKPMYIPYGSYRVELRRARKLSETSQTFVQDIILRRDFILSKESPTFFVTVRDEDLSVFPVDIRSLPLNADVFIDGKKVGKTPFQGIFPLGEHRLSLRKEGFFEHTEILKVDINTPYATEVELKTSLAGAHVNNARAALRQNLYQEAINELAETLKTQPTPSEEALSNYLLGKAYLGVGDATRALGYFQKAKEYEDQKYPALLGMVNAYAVQGQTKDALPLLVEVLLKAETEEVKKEANALFQKISPFRSVIYIYSEPAGAKVIVNDKPIEKITPVILHELPLGNYRLRLEKAGYQATDLNLTLSVNEFNPVIVTLKPLPQ